MIWLLDSVTIIYALNGQGHCRQRLNSAPTRGRVATSILAVAEVFYGVENDGDLLDGAITGLQVEDWY